MSRLDTDILEKLKKYSKDEESFKKIESLVTEIYGKLKRTEEQLDLLESAIRNDYDSIIITELDLEKPGPRIVYINDGFTKMTGYTKEEAIGKTPRMLQGPKTDRAILDRLKRRLIEGQAFFGHSINYRKDGTEFINQWDIHPLFNEDGEATHWVSYQRDVTDKKETAKAIFNTDFDDLLKRTEEFTLKFSKIGNTYECKFVTEGFEDLTGLDKSEVFDIGILSVIHEEDEKAVDEAIQNAFNGDTSTEYCRFRTADEGYIDVIQSFKPVWNEDKSAVESVKSVAKLELKES
jgi:PAS domain S-box-containing protein